MSAPWTKVHRREAGARLLELAAEAIRRGEFVEKIDEMVEDSDAEDVWRHQLECLDLDPARIDREVRRVRALAEGRLVRVTFPAVKVEGLAYQRATMATARAAAEGWNAGHPGQPRAYAVTVTRIRRPT